MSCDEPPASTIAARLAKLEAILSTAVNAIVTIDGAGTIESINPATSALFGYVAKELIGQNVKIFMPASYADEHDGYLANYLRTGTKKIIGLGREVTGRRKDGDTFPIHLAISEFEVDGRCQFVGVITDLSERDATAKAAEQALKNSENRLAHAQKMETIGQMAGGIAHDFNNLLTVIIGNLELIEPHLSDQNLRSRFEKIQEAATSGSNLTHRLLAFSQQLPFEPETIQINSLVLRTAELLRRTLGDHITLTTTLSSDLWPISTEPTQIESSLTNLAINARDAMPSGGRLIIETSNVVIDSEQAAARIEMKPGNYVSLAVSDTGTGIPLELRDRIFEPFFTTKGLGKGSGLGLAMIHGFVERSGGYMTLDSEMGNGATFTILLPRAANASTSIKTVQRAPMQLSAGDVLILVVEDDAAVRQLNITRLMRLGYQVAEASDGAQALAMLKDGLLPALVFSDVSMPGGISGRELLEQALTILPSVKVLLTSGYSEDPLTPVAPAPPTFKLLRKPHRIAELADAVRDALG